MLSKVIANYLLNLYLSRNVSLRLKISFKRVLAKTDRSTVTQLHNWKRKKRTTTKHSTITRYQIARIKTLNEIHNIYSQMLFVQSKRTPQWKICNSSALKSIKMTRPLLFIWFNYVLPWTFLPHSLLISNGGCLKMKITPIMPLYLGLLFDLETADDRNYILCV